MPLALAEVRSLLADRLKGRPTRANFRTGHLTMCTLVPMRSVPHRVVCLLGLDDGAFPRRTAPDGDDIIERDPCVGDRDFRSEDRQLLLDAVLAATDHLVVTYCGRDERTNAVLPPAVPLGELLDVIDATATHRHRCRPAGSSSSSTRCRPSTTATSPPACSLPTAIARGASTPSLSTARGPGGTGLGSNRRSSRRPSPALDDPLVEVDELVRFVQHPVKAFLRQRLGVSLSADEEEPDDGLPVQLDGLSKWAIGQRLVEQPLGRTRPRRLHRRRARPWQPAARPARRRGARRGGAARRGDRRGRQHGRHDGAEVDVRRGRRHPRRRPLARRHGQRRRRRRGARW